MGLVHATAVKYHECGFLLRGPSGCGKSDLAIRIMADGGYLVADDYVELSTKDGLIIGRAPEKIAGKIEARGAGILNAHRTLASTQLQAVIDLKPRDKVQRFPEPGFEYFLHVKLKRIEMCAFQHSALSILQLIAANLEQMPLEAFNG